MSGFRVFYTVQLTSGESIHERLNVLCREQSAELPQDVIRNIGMEHVVGVPESIHQVSEKQWEAEIIWPLSNIDEDITQFLNLLFGNISLMRGIKITGLSWADLPENLFPGPQFGITGIRKKWNIPERALSCTALKPMGFTTGKLAGLCYKFARAGVDIIKDDHGLANQSTASFEERVTACQKAISRAREETGKNSRYFPNVTASPSEIFKRIEFALEKKVEGILISPHLAGLGIMKEIQKYKIPIMAHPAFSGQLVSDPTHGFSIPFLYGSLWRALGADFIIYPNTGGRFSFSTLDCASLNTEARKDSPLGFAASWPTPGGGIQRETIPHWLNAYGNDTVFLTGGSLYQHPKGIEIAASEFVNMLT